jgi:DNA (cytosine-5)-methyltransferase 1
MSRTAGQGNELDFVIITDGGDVVRRPTPLECERLQGFPDRWTDIEFEGKPAGDSDRYRGLGNSMTIQAMEYIGHRINLINDEAYQLGVAV